jgi:hypothetical protein
MKSSRRSESRRGVSINSLWLCCPIPAPNGKLLGYSLTEIQRDLALAENFQSQRDRLTEVICESARLTGGNRRERSVVACELSEPDTALPIRGSR